jgi:mono/diheme cytochrome c family protein
MKTTNSMLLTASLAAVLALPVAAQQGTGGAAGATQSMSGKEVFTSYCATCHGTDAKGTGPAASVLKTRPADLTMLASRNKGQFPTAAVRETIVGEKRYLQAHGNSEMPIWGPVFRELGKGEKGGELLVTDLLKYLESLQQK